MAEEDKKKSAATEETEKKRKTIAVPVANMIVDMAWTDWEDKSLEQIQFGEILMLEGLGGMGLATGLTPKAAAFRVFMERWITAGNLAFLLKHSVQEALKHPEHDGKGTEIMPRPLTDREYALVLQSLDQLRARRSQPSKDFLTDTKRKLTRQDFEDDPKLCTSVGCTLFSLCKFVVKRAQGELGQAPMFRVQELIAKQEWPDGQLDCLFDPADPLTWVTEGVLSVSKLAAGGHVAAEVHIRCDGPRCLQFVKRGWFEPGRYRHFCDKCVASINKKECVCLVPFIHPGYLPPGPNATLPTAPADPASPPPPAPDPRLAPEPVGPEPPAATAPPPIAPEPDRSAP